MGQESVVKVMIRGHWSEVKGHWSGVNSQGSLVSGQRSLIKPFSGSVVKGHWSVVNGQIISFLQTLYETKGLEITSCSNEALKTGKAHSYGKTA